MHTVATESLQADKGFFHQPKAIWAIVFACVISFMGIGLIDPILPAIAVKLNATPSQVSLLFSSYTLIMSFAMLLTGFISSRMGPKWTMLAGLSLIVFFSIAGGLSDDIWRLVWLRGGWGLGNALFIATALSAIVELSNGGIARAVILYEAAIGLGFSVGPLLGGELGSISWRGPFFGVGALLLIAITSLLFLLPPLPRKKSKSALLDPLKALVNQRGLLTLGLTSLFYYVGFFILLAYSPFFMHLDEHGLGYVFFGWGLLLALTSVFAAGKVESLLGRSRAMYLLLSLFGLDLFIIGIWSSVSAVVITGVVLAGMLLGINGTLITTAVLASAPIDRAVISSAYNFIRFLGGAVGPVLAGILSKTYGEQVPFLAGGVMVFTGVLILWLGRNSLKAKAAETSASAAESTQQTIPLYNYRILVPIDGSSHSLHALQHAQTFARQVGERVLVTLLHVSPRILLSELSGEETRLNEKLDQQSQQILAPAAEFLKAAQIQHETLHVVGEPAETICQAAREGEYGLIVMGSRGLSSLSGAILGSVSNAVVQHSHCPVFIVK